MAWKCPSCNAEIEYIKYNVNTTCAEYGNADLPDHMQEPRTAPENPQRDQASFLRNNLDYNSDDNGDTEWDGQPEYECPECNENVGLGDLIWVSNEAIVNEITNTISELVTGNVPGNYAAHSAELHNQARRGPQRLPEELPAIIRPKLEIRETSHAIHRNNFRDQTDMSIICKKCFHVFIYENDSNTFSSNQQFYECPKCNTTNNCNEYHKLLNDGYYNRDNKTKNVTKKSKKAI